jgi:hypothetical protein
MAMLIGLLFPCIVNAASGSINIASSSTVVVGNKVTVTVTISSGTKMGSWQMSLNYDKSYLQLTNSTARDGGTFMIDYAEDPGVLKKTYTFTFKTLKSGTTKLSVDGYRAYVSSDLSALSLSANTKQIRIITQAELEASYSKNNNLSALEVEGFTLTPEFKTDILEYSVVVPENTKEVNIKANVQDKRASVNGIGTQAVNPGANKFSVVVRAQSGAEKTYVINVEVKDENPINVTVNGKNYTVVKIKENLPAASLYTETTININGFEIPAYKNDNTNLVLVGLKDEEGNISLYIYNKDKNEYQEYNEIGVNKITIYPLTSNEEIKGYKKDTITINGVKVDGYYYTKDSDYVIIYGINVETGDKGFYMYDKKMQSLIKYNDEYIIDLNKKIGLYSYIIIGFSGVFILMIIIMIALAKKRSGKQKKQKPIEKEIKKNVDEKNVIEEIN